ncbi:MAG: hypothetical protein WBE91_11755 [Steroidobacteraceae bacterium]
MSDSAPENLSPNEPEAPDCGGETLFKRKPRFTSLRGVRREYGALYMDLMNGRVSQKVAGTAGTLLSGIVKALEVELLEARLATLEERVGVSGALRTQLGQNSPRGVVGHA